MKHLKLSLNLAFVLAIVGSVFMILNPVAEANTDGNLLNIDLSHQIPPPQAQEGLYLQNNTNETIRAAILYYDYVVDDWIARWWWTIPPGGYAQPITGPLADYYYYIYAESPSRVWDGNVPVWVEGRQVGFQEIYVDTYTTFIYEFQGSSGGAGNPPGGNPAFPSGGPSINYCYYNGAYYWDISGVKEIWINDQGVTGPRGGLGGDGSALLRVKHRDESWWDNQRNWPWCQ